MSSAMQIILLERIENLGQMGDVVKVRNGYARNYLLPQKKALRATKDNVAYFETQRAALEKLNAEKRQEAEKLAKKVEGLKVVIIRHAAETGQLFGSVTARDIAQAATEQGKQEVARNQVQINQGLKEIGIFPVTIALHPEVKVTISVNVARSEEEAKVQEKTGHAVTAAAKQAAQDEAAAAAAAKAALLEDSAIAAEQEEAEEEAEKAAKKAAKASKKATKKAAKADDEAEEEASAEEE